MLRFLLINTILILTFSGYYQNETKSEILSEINKYRLFQKVKPFKENISLNEALKKIMERNYSVYATNKDSLREVLSTCHNFDYNIQLLKLELDKEEIDFIRFLKEKSEFEGILLNPLYNNIGYSILKENNRNILILLTTQNFIEFDPVFYAGFSDTSVGNPETKSALKNDWLSLGGKIPNKEEFQYVLYNEDINKEISLLEKNQVKIDEDGRFTIFIDFKLNENKNINRVLFYNNENKKIAKIKLR